MTIHEEPIGGQPIVDKLTRLAGMVDRQPRARILVATFAANLALGLLFSCCLFPLVSGPTQAETWGDGQLEVAQNVVLGNGFVFDPDALPAWNTGYLKREPLYELFLAAGLVVCGGTTWLGVAQSLVVALTAILVYAIATRVFDRKVGLIASLLYSISPFTYWYVSRVAYEPLAALMVAVMTWAVVTWFEEPCYERALASGMALGAAVLCRSTYLLLPVSLLPVFLFRLRMHLSLALAQVLTFLGVLFIVICPWVLRNYVVSREFVPMTTLGGVNYFIGNAMVDNYSLAHNTAGLLDSRGDKAWRESLAATEAQYPGISYPRLEALTEQRLRGLVFQDVMADVPRFLSKLVKGTILVWFLSTSGLKSNLLLAIQLPVLALSLLGLYSGIKFRLQVEPLLAVIAFQICVCAAISPLGRYSYPVFPLVVCLAANGLCELAAWVAAKQRAIGLAAAL